MLHMHQEKTRLSSRPRRRCADTCLSQRDARGRLLEVASGSNTAAARKGRAVLNRSAHSAGPGHEQLNKGRGKMDSL